MSIEERDGTMCLVGAPEHLHPSPGVFGLIFGRKSLAGSLIGGITETQAMLDLCAEKGIAADMDRDNPHRRDRGCYARARKGDVKYRFLIDSRPLAKA